MKKAILLLLSVFAILLFGNINETDPSQKKSDFQNVLVDVGEVIYFREGCHICHTQKLDEANSSKSSLDGLGGKYTDSWHYAFLKEPKSLIPWTIMPNYEFLYEKKISKAQVEKVVIEKYGQSASIEEAWNKLNIQMDALIAEIEKIGIKVEKRSESLALIAYLQQIPASNSQMKKDSIEKNKVKCLYVQSVEDLEQQNNKDTVNIDGFLQSNQTINEGKDSHFFNYEIVLPDSTIIPIRKKNLIDKKFINNHVSLIVTIIKDQIHNKPCPPYCQNTAKFWQIDQIISIYFDEK